MHNAAYLWIARHAPANSHGLRVLEIGSRDINGTPRPLFPGADYTGVDLLEGDGVDIVTDADDYTPDMPFDIVVCAEMLEHTPNPAATIAAIARALKPGGLAIITAAALERSPHSALDGGPLHKGEHYKNIKPADLDKWLNESGFESVVVAHDPAVGDVYATAIRLDIPPAPPPDTQKRRKA